MGVSRGDTLCGDRGAARAVLWGHNRRYEDLAGAALGQGVVKRSGALVGDHAGDAVQPAHVARAEPHERALDLFRPAAACAATREKRNLMREMCCLLPLAREGA